jgi:hypothetical protein
MGNYQRRLTRNLTQGRCAGVRFQGDGGSNGWNMGDWQHKSILEEEEIHRRTRILQEIRTRDARWHGDALISGDG